MSECPGCRALLPFSDYPADNRYGVTSAECRQVFDEILVKEQELFGYPAVHRLIIDTYWVQHLPHDEVQWRFQVSSRFIAASIQSISIHLIALYCAIDQKIPLRDIASVMDHILQRMSLEKIEFPRLQAPDNLGSVRAIDVRNAIYQHETLSLDTYEQYAWQWARSAYLQWQEQHSHIAQWYHTYAGR